MKPARIVSDRLTRGIGRSGLGSASVRPSYKLHQGYREQYVCARKMDRAKGTQVLVDPYDYHRFDFQVPQRVVQGQKRPCRDP